mmetsp:Transcript_18848/g.26733  ORF Transcript_18848/g.26733 Transcript_18848/m.26733 type:complete len:358 (+) Transcript_18848:87-1160(+)
MAHRPIIIIIIHHHHLIIIIIIFFLDIPTFLHRNPTLNRIQLILCKPRHVILQIIIPDTQKRTDTTTLHAVERKQLPPENAAVEMNHLVWQQSRRGMHILPIILTIMIPVKEVITILIAPRERIRIIIITVGEAVENELATLEGVAVERKVEGSVVVLVPIATKRNHDVVLALRRTIVRVVEEEGSEEPKADRHHQLHQNLYLLLRRRFELMIDTHHIMTTPTATRIILHKVVKENIIVVLRACRHHLVRNSVKILWQIIPLILLTPMKMHIILLEEVLLVYLHLDQNEDDGHHPPPRRPITNKSNAAIVVRILVVMTVVVTVQTILDTGIGKGGIEDDEVEVSEKKTKMITLRPPL